MTKEERKAYFSSLGYSKEDIKLMIGTLAERGVFVNGKDLHEVRLRDLNERDFTEIVNQYTSYGENKFEKALTNHFTKLDSTLQTAFQTENGNKTDRFVEDKSLHDNDFAQWVLDKLDSGNQNDIAEKDLQKLVWNYEKDRVEGDSGRWTKSVQSICELKGRLVAVDWQEGLTECQENEFYDVPYYVKAVEKTVVITEYVPIEEKEVEQEEQEEECER